VVLSVTLKAVSCMAAVLTTPLALAVLQPHAEGPTDFPVPLGMLMGQLFILLVLPVLGGGATLGALGGHMAEYGIGRDFIEQVRGKVTEGTSALFLLVGQVTADRVVEAFKAGERPEIIASNLSTEQEQKLKAAFAS
jgi:uncharacterized membrane protein